MFVRSGGVWSQQAKLLDPAGVQKDGLGGSVSLSGETALVGASGLTFTKKGAAPLRNCALYFLIHDTALKGDIIIRDGIGSTGHARIGLALTQRPEISMLEQAIQAKASEQQVARSDYYPQVELTGKYQQEAPVIEFTVESTTHSPARRSGIFVTRHPSRPCRATDGSLLRPSPVRNRP